MSATSWVQNGTRVSIHSITTLDSNSTDTNGTTSTNMSSDFSSQSSHKNTGVSDSMESLDDQYQKVSIQPAPVSSTSGLSRLLGTSSNADSGKNSQRSSLEKHTADRYTTSVSSASSHGEARGPEPVLPSYGGPAKFQIGTPTDGSPSPFNLTRNNTRETFPNADVAEKDGTTSAPISQLNSANGGGGGGGGTASTTWSPAFTRGYSTGYISSTAPTSPIVGPHGNFLTHITGTIPENPSVVTNGNGTATLLEYPASAGSTTAGATRPPSFMLDASKRSSTLPSGSFPSSEIEPRFIVKVPGSLSRPVSRSPSSYSLFSKTRQRGYSGSGSSLSTSATSQNSMTDLMRFFQKPWKHSAPGSPNSMMTGSGAGAGTISISESLTESPPTTPTSPATGSWFRRRSVSKIAQSSLNFNGGSPTNYQGRRGSLSKLYGKPGKSLGEGAGGNVRIITNKDNKMYAVKEFRRKQSSESSREYSRKVSAEYCIGLTLKHPNIIETVDIVYEAEKIYQVMEYCEYDLFAIVMSGKMSRDEIYCDFKQLMAGVKYMHDSGLAHRDLKLDNCVINSQGIVKIIDFGSAVVYKYQENERLHDASGVVGSDPYLAPEVIYNTNYDPCAADIWSAAIVFCCMLMKKFPWKAPKLSDPSFKLFCQGNPTAPPDFESLASVNGVSSAMPSPAVSAPPTPQISSNSTTTATPGDTSPTSQTGGDKSIQHKRRPHHHGSNKHHHGQANNNSTGPERLLRNLPEEVRPLVSNMLTLDPTARNHINDFWEDSWLTDVNYCTITVEDEVYHAPGHTHSTVAFDEAHIAMLEKKNKKKKPREKMW